MATVEHEGSHSQVNHCAPLDPPGSQSWTVNSQLATHAPAQVRPAWPSRRELDTGKSWSACLRQGINLYDLPIILLPGKPPGRAIRNGDIMRTRRHVDEACDGRSPRQKAARRDAQASTAQKEAERPDTKAP